MMSLTKSDFSKICRICLKQPDNLISILNSEILNMFHTCTKIKIENNKFPENICPSCLDKLNTAYTFHQQCERSENILHQIVERDDKSRFLAISNVQENQIFIKNDANDLYESKEMIFKEKNIFDDLDENNTNDTQNEWENGENNTLQEPKLEMDNCQKSPLLETPSQIHSNGGSYTCTKCFKIFTRKFNLTRHETLVHSNNQTYTCAKCFKTFKRLGSLRNHERVVHWKQVTNHPENSEENQIENETNDLYESKEVIFEENNILDHLDENNTNDTQNEREGDPLQKPELETSNCEKRTLRQEETNDEEFSHLDKSVEYTETNHEVKSAHAQNHDQLTCHDCGRTFVHRGALKKHRHMHLNGRSLTCKICFKTFTRSFNLRTHERGVHKIQSVEHTKTSEENQTENEIDNLHESKQMIFKEKNILIDSDEKFLRLDRLIHSNGRSLTCKICFKTYSRIDNLRRHQRRVHKIHFSKHAKDSEENQLENETDDLYDSKETVFDENNILNDLDGLKGTNDTKREWKCDTLQDPKLENMNDCQKSSYRCETCFEEFLDLDKLVEHTQAHHEVKPVTCTVCNTVFTLQLELRIHMQQNHSQIICHDCGRTFSHMNGLKRHSRMHLNGRSLTCTKCFKTFNRSSNLRRHLRSHLIQAMKHAKRSKKNDTFQASESEMNNCRKSPYQCEICYEEFLHLDKLVEHTKMNHECNICQKKVVYLKDHQEVHLTGNNFQCEKCSKYFATEARLKRHTIYTHEKRYVKPVLCNVCGIQTANKGFLNRHMRIHTGEKPFKCDICDKSFTHKFNFVKHKAIHSDERPFTCNICPKGFKTKVNLKKHMFLHTGKRPHVCHICSKSFSYRNNLRTHMRVH